MPQVTLDTVGGSLQRAQSANSLDSIEKDAKDDVLKRVSSEPWLSGQEKGTYFKRKLPFSKQNATIYEDGNKKTNIWSCVLFL